MLKLHPPIDFQELVVLTRQLATLVLSGVGITRALATLREQARNATLRAAFAELEDKVSSGFSLSQAASRWPRVFSPFYLAMLRTGEATGQLDEALERLALSMEKDMTVRHKVKSAMVYPAFVLTLTLLLTMLVFYTVIPGFVEMFRTSGVQLPLATQLLILASDLLVSPSTWLISLAVLLEMAWLYQESQKRPQWKLKIWKVWLSLPLFGKLMRDAALCRFCTSMQTLIQCGTPLDRSLLVAGAASGDPVFEHSLQEAIQAVREGTPLSTFMVAYPQIYPAQLAQMIQTGEESSTLDAMFAHVARSLEDDLDNQIQSLSAAIEPVLLMIVASIVGFIIISIFLPLYGTLDQLA